MKQDNIKAEGEGLKNYSRVISETPDEVKKEVSDMMDDLEKKDDLMSIALEKYCTPYGKANPETYAYIEGLKDAEEIFNEAKKLFLKLLPPENYGENYDAERLYEIIGQLAGYAASKATVSNGEEARDPFIEKHLVAIKEKIKDALIYEHIGKMHGDLSSASIKYFLETGTINGGFREHLLSLMDGWKKHKLDYPATVSNGDEASQKDSDEMDKWLIWFEGYISTQIMNYNNPNATLAIIATLRTKLGVNAKMVDPLAPPTCKNCNYSFDDCECGSWEPEYLETAASQVPVQSSDEKYCDAMGHYGGDPKPDIICSKCGKNFRSSDEASSGPDVDLLQKKVEFYRAQTDKVRELVFSSRDIGEPCQPLYEAIVDKIKSQQEEITRLKSQSYTRWVKASKRLPDEDRKVHWRHTETKLPITIGGAYNAINNNKPELIEWLSETPSIPDKDLVHFLYSKRYSEESIKSVDRQYAYGVTDIINDVLEFIHQSPSSIQEGEELLPNLDKSTQNLSQIKDKDKWLDELRGEDFGYHHEPGERI